MDEFDAFSAPLNGSSSKKIPKDLTSKRILNAEEKEKICDDVRKMVQQLGEMLLDAFSLESISNYAFENDATQEDVAAFILQLARDKDEDALHAFVKVVMPKGSLFDLQDVVNLASSVTAAGASSKSFRRKGDKALVFNLVTYPERSQNRILARTLVDAARKFMGEDDRVLNSKMLKAPPLKEAVSGSTNQPLGQGSSNSSGGSGKKTSKSKSPPKGGSSTQQQQSSRKSPRHSTTQQSPKISVDDEDEEDDEEEGEDDIDVIEPAGSDPLVNASKNTPPIITTKKVDKSSIAAIVEPLWPEAQSIFTAAGVVSSHNGTVPPIATAVSASNKKSTPLSTNSSNQGGVMHLSDAVAGMKTDADLVAALLKFSFSRSDEESGVCLSIGSPPKSTTRRFMLLVMNQLRSLHDLLLNSVITEKQFKKDVKKLVGTMFGMKVTIPYDNKLYHATPTNGLCYYHAHYQAVVAYKETGLTEWRAFDFDSGDKPNFMASMRAELDYWKSHEERIKAETLEDKETWEFRHCLPDVIRKLERVMEFFNTVDHSNPAGWMYKKREGGPNSPAQWGDLAESAMIFADRWDRAPIVVFNRSSSDADETNRAQLFTFYSRALQKVKPFKPQETQRGILTFDELQSMFKCLGAAKFGIVYDSAGQHFHGLQLPENFQQVVVKLCDALCEELVAILPGIEFTDENLGALIQRVDNDIHAGVHTIMDVDNEEFTNRVIGNKRKDKVSSSSSSSKKRRVELPAEKYAQLRAAYDNLKQQEGGKKKAASNKQLEQILSELFASVHEEVTEDPTAGSEGV